VGSPGDGRLNNLQNNGTLPGIIIDFYSCREVQKRFEWLNEKNIRDAAGRRPSSKVSAIPVGCKQRLFFGHYAVVWNLGTFMSTVLGH
jgi:hypothetical protein